MNDYKKVFRSRLLEKWIDELIEQEQTYYLERYIEYIELKELSRKVRKETKELLTLLRHKYDDEKFTQELSRKINEEAWQQLSDLGYVYDKQHFINHGTNFTAFKVEYKGEMVMSTEKLYLKGNHNGYTTTYSIYENYFFKHYSSQSLYSLISKSSTNEDGLMKLAEKNVRAYVKQLIIKIEARFGKILTVTDSYLSNIEHIVFNCEEASCYLERITAGGYNIQRLHNRIIIKKLK